MSKVLLERVGPLVAMTPWVPAVGGLLSYDRTLFKAGQGSRTVVEAHNLFFLDKGGQTAYIPAATRRDIIQELKRLGYDPEYIETRNLDKLYPEPHLDKLDELRPGQREVIDAVVNNDCGIIVSSTGFGKSFCIMQLCKIYPKSNFIIVAPGIAETRNLYDAILPVVGAHNIGRLGGGKTDASKRVTVTTVQSALRADFQKCDIFIFDEAHTLGHNKTTFNLLKALQDSRVYGFTATPEGRGDNSDKVIWSFFGPTLVNFTYQENEARGNVVPLDVFVYDIDCEPIESSKSRFGSTFIQNKRRFYWRNEYRNVAIASIARSIPEDQQVLIMVESVDHLIELGQWLPDYALVCGIGNDLETRAKKKRIKLENRLCDNKDTNSLIYEEFKEGKVKKVISSMTWKQGVSFDGLNVLIRADGSPNDITSTQIPGRLSRIAPGKDRALLIDFKDSFNPTALSYYYKRSRNYKKNGWDIYQKGDPLNDRQFD